MRRYRIWLARAAMSLAILTCVIGVLTIIWRDWIEALTGWSPDLHTGSLELVLIAVLLVASVLVLSGRAGRSTHAAEDPERYRPESAIRRYLMAKSANAVTPELLWPAAHERWAVKTAADPGAQGLMSQTPTSATIAELRAVHVPSMLPRDARSDGAEKTVWEVTAILRAFRRDLDGDLHLVIADDQGSTMIAEIPNPGDITAPSYFAEQIANARAAFDSRFHVVENSNEPAAPSAPGSGAGLPFQDVAVPVTVTGIGFFDFNHGQRGAAPNAIELHPVISIVFNG